MLGNNMFAYCNNSPVSHCDPNGYYVHTYNDKLSGLGIAEGIVDAGSGGGGGYIAWRSGKCMPPIDIDDIGVDVSFFWNGNDPDSFYYEQALLVEFTALKFGGADFTLADLTITALKGSWDFDICRLGSSLLTANAGVKLNKDGLYIGAIATFFEPFVVFDVCNAQITLSAAIGSYGAELYAGTDGFGAALGFGLFGLSLQVDKVRG